MLNQIMAIPLLKCIQYFILAEKLGKNIACPIVILMLVVLQ